MAIGSNIGGYRQYQPDPSQEQDQGQGQMDDAGYQAQQAAYQHVIQMLNEQPLSQQEQESETQRRLQGSMAAIEHMLGPAPVAPTPPRKFERIGNSIGDTLNALAQMEHGFHPTIGSGPHRQMLPPVDPSHYYQSMLDRQTADEQLYQGNLYRRGVIGAQMLPSMMHSMYPPMENEYTLESRKLTGIAALGAFQKIANRNKHDAGDLAALIKSVSPSFLLEDGSTLQPGDAGYDETFEGAKTVFRQYDPNMSDGDVNSLAKLAAAGAGGLSPQALARLGSAAASSSSAAQRNVGQKQAEPLNITQYDKASQIFKDVYTSEMAAARKGISYELIRLKADKGDAVATKQRDDYEENARKKATKAALDAAKAVYPNFKPAQSQSQAPAQNMDEVPAQEEGAGVEPVPAPAASPEEQIRHLIKTTDKDTWKMISDYGRRVGTIMSDYHGGKIDAHKAAHKLVPIIAHPTNGIFAPLDIDLTNDESVLAAAEDQLDTFEKFLSYRAGSE